MIETTQVIGDAEMSYATGEECVQSFNEEMHDLFLLAFLLTADHDRAEQCLVAAIGDCVEGAEAFIRWARVLTRRAVIRNAIQMIKPAPEGADRVSFTTLRRPPAFDENNPFAGVLLLDAFERFVYVLSILEGQSEEECSNLLGCSRRDVMMARVVALQRQVSGVIQVDGVLAS